MNDWKYCHAENTTDINGNPSGGFVAGEGLSIHWQEGALGRGTDRKPANGAFVETVLTAAKQRLEFYQEASGGKFACNENALAIDAINVALHWLEVRTEKREERKVEGTHTA